MKQCTDLFTLLAGTDKFKQSFDTHFRNVQYSSFVRRLHSQPCEIRLVVTNLLRKRNIGGQLDGPRYADRTYGVSHRA